jgi:hypothetical protein
MRALVVLLILPFLITLAACGGDDDSDGATDGGADVGKVRDQQRAYGVAFRQCDQLGYEVLRANYKSPNPEVLASAYVSAQDKYFGTESEFARRGCLEALRRQGGGPG